MEIRWTNAPTKTKEIFALLKQYASEMRTVNYEEVAHDPTVNIHPAGIGKQLGFIRDHVCRVNGWPWINAIAVSKSCSNGRPRWRPSDPFWPSGTTWPADHASKDEETMWRGIVLQVFAFDWTPIEQ